MAGARLPVPEVLAIISGWPEATQCPDAARCELHRKLPARRGPLSFFAKPVAGKYSIPVISGNSYDSASDEIALLDGARRAIGGVAGSLVGVAGYLIQRRLAPIKNSRRCSNPGCGRSAT